MSLIENLYRYPVKGLSAEALLSVELSKGRGIPLDRKFAITNGKWKFTAQDYQPRPKTDFLVLLKHGELAEYKTVYDEAPNVLSLTEQDGAIHKYDFASEHDRDALSMLLAKRLSLEVKPQLVEVEGTKFTDVSVVSPSMMNSISLINLASIEALESQVLKPLNPLRFRANVYFRTGTPWEELGWVGKEVKLGSAIGKVVLKTRRCVAVNVNPITGDRDISVTQALVKNYQHMDMGVYVEIIRGGRVELGDEVTLVGE